MCSSTSPNALIIVIELKENFVIVNMDCSYSKKELYVCFNNGV